MVTDEQVRKLMKMIQTEETQSVAAAKAGMSDKTARKYVRGRIGGKGANHDAFLH